MNFRTAIISLMLTLISIPLFAVPFMDGEKLTFDVKYGIINAAEASLEAKSATFQGKPVWQLTTSAKTHAFFDKVFKVRDKVESWWDKNTLLPYKFSKNLQEGGYRQHRVHVYDHANKTSTYQKWHFKRNYFENKEMEIPANTQDIISAFYTVRNQKLEVGKPIRVHITADGRSMNTEIMVHRKEKRKTIFGEVNCLVIEPKLKSEAVFKQSGRILIWLTDDEYKIPVRLESKVTIGSFVATLKNAKNVPLSIKQ